MMRGLRAIALALVELFVEDAGYALAILVWLLVAGALSWSHIGGATVNAFVLLAGLLAIVAVSVRRAAGR